MGHRAGAYGRGVGRDLSVGARSCQFTATDWTEPGSTLGKVNNNSVHTVSAYIHFYFYQKVENKTSLKSTSDRKLVSNSVLLLIVCSGGK